MIKFHRGLNSPRCMKQSTKYKKSWQQKSDTEIYIYIEREGVEESVEVCIRQRERVLKERSGKADSKTRVMIRHAEIESRKQKGSQIRK